VDDPADLLWIKLRQFLGWHVINEEVVPDLGVGIDALLMRLGNPLSEDSRVFRVEEEVDSSEFDVLAGEIPLSTVDLSLLVP